MYLGSDRGHMATEGTDERSTERTRIQTYVPAYQKSEWEREADEMDMSLSEFVRTMVQAGRSDLELAEPDRGEVADDTEPRGGPSSDRDPRGESLEDRVLSELSEGSYSDWDDLLAAVTDDVESRLESTLQSLQEDNRVTYSGRHGGYTLA